MFQMIGPDHDQELGTIMYDVPDKGLATAHHGVARAESRYDVIDGLSARVVLGSGQKKMHGPIPEIEADLLFAHREFWRR